MAGSTLRTIATAVVGETTIEFPVWQCSSCGGTGVYSGAREEHGVAVPCYNCKKGMTLEETFRPFIRTVRCQSIEKVKVNGEEIPYEEYFQANRL